MLGVVSPNQLIQREGDTVEMFCEATGSPPPSLVWYKDGRELGASSDRVTASRNRVQIRNIAKHDAGVYSCFFRNVAGTVSHIIKLIIQGECYSG